MKHYWYIDLNGQVQTTTKASVPALRKAGVEVVYSKFPPTPTKPRIATIPMPIRRKKKDAA